MKLDQKTIEWVERNHKLVQELILADKLVEHGQVVLFYQDGKYIGLDACPRKRIRATIDEESPVC